MTTIADYLENIDPMLLSISEGRRELTKYDPMLFALTYLPHHLEIAKMFLHFLNFTGHLLNMERLGSISQLLLKKIEMHLSHLENVASPHGSF